MNYSYCALIAVLMALCTPCHSYGDELPIDTSDGLFAQMVRSVDKTKPPADGVEICVNYRERYYLTLDEYSETGLCLSTGKSVEEMAEEFRRAQEEVQRARRVAALNKCARYVAERYGGKGHSYGPLAAPLKVKEVICAANEIDTFPYLWGGGHGSYEDSGYDCSGAVSYALHGGGFLETPLNSTGLSGWGEPGVGRWVTVYANGEHAWMVVAGVRFDTREPPSGETGPRWHSTASSPAGFVVRHPAGF
jgi:hypothetical protein